MKTNMMHVPTYNMTLEKRRRGNANEAMILPRLRTSSPVRSARQSEFKTGKTNGTTKRIEFETLGDSAEDDEDLIDVWGSPDAAASVPETVSPHGFSSFGSLSPTRETSSAFLHLSQSCPELFPKYPKKLGTITTRHTTFLSDTSLGSLRKAKIRKQTKVQWLERKKRDTQVYLEMIETRGKEELERDRLRLERKTRRLERKHKIQVKNATTIQSFWRGSRIRLNNYRNVQRQQAAATKIQKQVRRIAACAHDRAAFQHYKKNKAATRIECMYRSSKARKRAAEVRKAREKAKAKHREWVTNAAALTIQTSVRGLLAKNSVRKLREEDQAKRLKAEQKRLEAKRRKEDEEAAMIARIQEQRRANLKSNKKRKSTSKGRKGRRKSSTTSTN